MKLSIKGGGDLVLSKKDFIASGGEGSVYARSGKCYKIYTNSTKMIPSGKIDELKQISNPNVIKPEQILLDGNNPIGYSMRYVTDTHAICKLFPKAFKQRNNITQEIILELIKNIQQSLVDIHKGNVLVVDLNEMNLLVDKNFKNVFYIDVDSYETPHFPATAIMDSIRDWHVTGNKWTKETDWFSWGIIVFQLLTGIHPYKGKHPSVNGLVERMKSNLSVLRPDVSVPKMVQLDAIPEAYKQWFKEVFDNGKRIGPPTGPVEAVVLNVIPIANSNKLIIIEERDPRIPNKVLKYIKDNNLPYTQIMESRGMTFVLSGETITELRLTNTILSSRIAGYIMPKATTLHEGIVIQNTLGDWHGLVFPNNEETYQISLPDLKGYKIIDAKYEKKVLIIIGMKHGKYDKFVYRFYAFGFQVMIEPKLFWKEEDITYSGINFTVLDTGVCACINEKEELLLFAASNSSSDIKKIEDDAISSDMKLFSHGNNLMFTKDNKVYKISMRK